MKNTLIVIGIAILVAGIGLGIFLPSPTPTPEITPGAMPGNNLVGPCIIVGGVESCYVSVPGLNSASTTLAVIKQPHFGNATTTLSHVLFQITTGTSTASTIVFATSTSPYSTSSVPFTAAVTVASGAKADLVWTPAVSWSGNGTIIGPNDYILMKTEGVGLSGYTYVGKVKMVFNGYQN